MTENDKSLHELKLEMREQFSKLNSQVEVLQLCVEKIDHHIEGNGKPGIRIELDRLKQIQVRYARMNNFVVTAVSGVVVGLCVVIIKYFLDQ